MHRQLSYLLAFSALSITAFPQSTRLARTSGLTAAPAVRNLSTDDTPHPQPAASPAPAPVAQSVPTANPIPAGKKLISGTINEKGSGPLEGVVVATKDGKIVSGSMQDGQYYIEIPRQDSVLVFSLDGYATRVIKLHPDDDELNVTLQAPDPTGPAGPAPAPFSTIGPWRGTFELRPGVEVPFNFEIRTGKNGIPEAFFLNGAERADGGPVSQTTDSFFISLDQYDNELAFPIGEGALTGSLRHQDKKGTPLTVRIEPGKTQRFEENGAKPAGDLTGTYDVIFVNPSGKEEKTVGLFKQQGNKLTGTFLRVTGDARYLEGIVEGNEFYLSSFFGSGPSYYKGSFTSDGHLTGESIGAKGKTPFTGALDPRAALPDPYKLTYLKPGYDAFSFQLPDIDDKPISLQDARFKNKVVIVTIGGTWCPNCVDEASFLAPWYKANKDRGIEIVSIQYERSTDTAYVRKVLTRMRDKYDIQYVQVFGGLADKQAVATSLPSLNTFLAFPTTIVIDRKGRVAEIHTGYSGPATGPYYQEFLKEFNAEIDRLLTQ